MKLFTSVNDPEVAAFLNAGKVGIVRTDTLYGIVCRANFEASVSRVYQLKDRSEHKSPIVLISSPSQLFDQPPVAAKDLLHNVWPGPVSVILPSIHAPVWLRRENDSIAYRLPAEPSLRQLIDTTGPLIAPSANPEGSKPAMNIHEAKDYFGESVDFYVDGGQVQDETPSQLVLVKQDGTTERLR